MAEWSTAARTLTSFDGAVSRTARVAMPDRYRYWDSLAQDGCVISRGAGLSYCAASFGADAVTIDHRCFDRVLGFDSASGLVQVEAGISLGALFQFLEPRGYYLPTQPGYPNITIGGCIAAEVHGKNHVRDGCFSRQVAELTLFHPRHGMLALSPQKDNDLFDLTCGGYGLTGSIITATLQARKLPASDVSITTRAIDDVARLPAVLHEQSGSADFVYSWHDFNTSATGAGFVACGAMAPGRNAKQGAGALGAYVPGSLESENRGALGPALWGRWTAALATRAYRALSGAARAPKAVSLFDSLFPMHSRAGYFRLFGARGFCEFQAVVPGARFDEFVAAIRGYLRRRPLAITLASAKLFQGEQRLLRFSGTGVCFALDFPRSADSTAFLEFLDALTSELSLLPNIIKDSRLPRDVVARAYPEYEAFRRRLRDFDPARLYRSELSARLDL